MPGQIERPDVSKDGKNLEKFLTSGLDRDAADKDAVSGEPDSRGGKGRFSWWLESAH